MSAPPGRRSGPAHHLEPAHDDVSAVNHEAYAPGRTQRWTRSATFVLINRSCVEFRGAHVREHYIKLFRRGPVYNTRTKSWVTTPQRMKDLVCQLERHGYDIVIQADPDPDQTEVIGTAIETTPASRPPRQPDPLGLEPLW